MQEKVLILDFGSQYTQLIARRIRELFIYCEIHPFNNPPKHITEFKAVVLSGSPFSVRADDAPHPELEAIKGKITPLRGLLWRSIFSTLFWRTGQSLQ
jgi:GMP synthase (glutamine-hydrolysing)